MSLIRGKLGGCGRYCNLSRENVKRNMSTTFINFETVKVSRIFNQIDWAKLSSFKKRVEGWKASWRPTINIKDLKILHSHKINFKGFREVEESFFVWTLLHFTKARSTRYVLHNVLSARFNMFQAKRYMWIGKLQFWEMRRHDKTAAATGR